MKVYKSVDELIGRTPLMELCNIEKKFGVKAKILAKLEFLNPAGSVKDRVAKRIIEDAELCGKLKSDSVIIEPTSGNTGIGIASVSASKGYKSIIVMPDTMSEERIKLMKAYGAEVVLSDGKKGMTGAIELAEELSKKIPGSLIAGQFVNQSNVRAHFDSTGPEIYEDTDGNVDIFVSAVGTGGTVTGTGNFLKSKKPSIKVVAVEPESSPYLSRGIAGAHKIQGIGAGFIPEVLDTSVYDEIITVTDESAFKYGRLIGTCEGFLVGISSGAALCAALKIAEKNESENKTIVVIFPDSGDRYLSTQLYS